MAQTQVGIPFNLLVYKPKQRMTALCWQVNLETQPVLNLLDFEVEIDVVEEFNSINKKTYTKDNVTNYQDGKFFKAFVIEDPLLFEAQTYYWRVRVNSADYVSQWSDYKKENILSFLDSMEYNAPTKITGVNDDTVITIQKTIKDNTVVFDTVPASSPLTDGLYERYTTQEFIEFLETEYNITDSFNVYVGPYKFNINQITWYEDTETAERLLPDNYVYTKTGNTNIKRILEMYMRLIGVFKDEAIQVANNYNYRKTQDEDLYDMLGVLLTYTRNIDEPFITYKYELLNLWNAYLHQGTIEAFDIIIETLFGVLPQIEILKDRVDETWYLYEQMQLLSIDGSTPADMNINVGDAFYNADLDKILIATQGSTVGSWDNAYEQDLSETTTYQVMEDNELKNYQYVATSNGFYEGIPNVTRYYVRDSSSLYTIRPNPYLYTNQYLAHNLLITIENVYKVDLDEKILLEILNNLKPLNINIILNIKNDLVIPYSYGTIGQYGQEGNFWGSKKEEEGE